jgi:hypothetical protein
MLKHLGRDREALACERRALQLTANPAESRLLERRLASSGLLRRVSPNQTGRSGLGRLSTSNSATSGEYPAMPGRGPASGLSHQSEQKLDSLGIHLFN